MPKFITLTGDSDGAVALVPLDGTVFYKHDDHDVTVCAIAQNERVRSITVRETVQQIAVAIEDAAEAGRTVVMLA